ncbi:MAG: GSCFA domain-containing protein [Chitinispirillaceae bacterium]|nr:GSCFA domain-containing protein [Chitinispirillaceae bacterium]
MATTAKMISPPFRTVIPVARLTPPLSHTSHLLGIGSCFAEHIGNRLESYRFISLCNPTGTLFNPLSIEILIRRLLENKRFSEKDLLFHDGRWHGFEHHSTFSGSDPESVLHGMNESFDRAVSVMKNADYLMLTFGSAAFYRHLNTERIVANCHKIPGSAFERTLTSSIEIADLYRRLFTDLLSRRPGLRIILTVSPVRHLRDDPHENSVSKARLIDAVHELESSFTQVYYFPAWEIVMDELRDYRFYAEDMAHPGETAIAYIWQRFCESCIDERSASFIKAFEPVLSAMGHRIQNPDTPSARAFFERMRKTVAGLMDRYPETDLTQAAGYFSPSGG